MAFVKSLLLSCAVVGLAGAVQAGGIVIKYPYARVSTQMSKSGAAFMEIENSGDTADRLIVHVMLMGLKHPLKQGDVVHLTLTFQTAGAVAVDVPVDNTRKGPMARMKMDD
jgi:copper(I)-binding protein